tara:strand:+ start:162 stop:713 length:552 start_codon:yes stop_codon:yes gene_type:complete
MRIAICGAICSGKTTLSHSLMTAFGMERYAFADTVKEYATDLFGMERKNRKLIQDFAEKMKEIDEDVWIKNLDKTLTNRGGMDNVVIDDLRFMNEYQYLLNHNFYIIRINIEKIDQLKRLRSTYPDNWIEHVDRLTHRSENQRTLFMVDLDITADDDGFDEVFKHIVENPYDHPGLYTHIECI